MEKSASFHDYGLCKKSSVYLGIEPLLQRAASTGDAQLLLTLLQVRLVFIIDITYIDCASLPMLPEKFAPL